MSLTLPVISQQKRRCRTGITVLEVFVAMVMTAILASSLTIVFSEELTLQRSIEARRAQQNRTDAMEKEITRMLRGAKLSTSLTDTSSFFQGVTDSGASAPIGCNRVTLTTTSPGVPIAALVSTDDFLTQQDKIGPVGGVSEVSFGTGPIGNAGGQSGLFERIQHPSDADPTQGGNETLLDPDVASIGFQFWDGLQWESTWDTTVGITTTTHRLPEAVQVTYTLANDSYNTQHVFTVALPSSDVTPQNPYVTATSTAGGTQ
jgi:type II secretory pathway pseudopilin PulG